MNKIFSILTFSLFAVVLFTACNADDAVEMEQMDDDPVLLEAATQLNVSYGANSQQVYDIYLPEGRSADKTKVIILVHGGGWVEGDKADVNGIIDLVQSTNPNHAIVNMNYTLATFEHAAFPNQFLDIDAVINQVTTQSEALQILPEYGLIGLSAGAHISLQYDSVYDLDDQVKFVCDIVGPCDFTDPFYQNQENFNLYLAALTDESAYPAGTDIAVALSPALQVNTNTSPTVLFYGNMDELVPLSNGNTLESNLTISGVAHQYTVYDGGHGNWNDLQYADLQSKVNVYIETYLNVVE